MGIFNKLFKKKEGMVQPEEKREIQDQLVNEQSQQSGIEEKEQENEVVDSDKPKQDQWGNKEVALEESKEEVLANKEIELEKSNEEVLVNKEVALKESNEEVLANKEAALEESKEEVLANKEAALEESNQEVLANKEIALEESKEEALVNQEPHQEEIQEGEQVPAKKGLLGKLFSGLAKTRDSILNGVEDVLSHFKKIDEELYEELEEALIIADFGVDTTLSIMEQLRNIVHERRITDPSQLKTVLVEIITTILTSQKVEPVILEGVPNVILVIGVNGAGKTTTIGKLANQLKQEGKKVVLAAADTFRAAATEQLQVWADRAQVDLIKHEEGSDPASVVYDGVQAAKARKADVLICDTAGRLQNKTNLMKELEKIARIIEREYPEAHKQVLIVLDATTGQNALSQVKLFKEVAPVDGIVLTKLDGTAKGGAIVGICETMKVPVKYIGVGEKIEDLQTFDPNSFAKALFAENME
jgi:fused signal recognition particle receptor